MHRFSKQNFTEKKDPGSVSGMLFFGNESRASCQTLGERERGGKQRACGLEWTLNYQLNNAHNNKFHMESWENEKKRSVQEKHIVNFYD